MAGSAGESGAGSAPVTSGEPIVRELDPPPAVWDAFLRLRRLPGAILLDSALELENLGRFSFVTADPFERIRIETSRDDPRDAGPSGGPFATLRVILARFRAPTVPGLPPFQGGAAGLFSYSLGRHIERLPRPERDRLRVPDLLMGIHDWVLAYDHAVRRAWIVSHGFPASGDDRRRRARERIDLVMRLLDGAPLAEDAGRDWRGDDDALGDELRRTSWPVGDLPRVLSNFDRPAYLEAVGRAIEYVHAGDVFQVNLSQQLWAPLDASPLELHRRLRERNPTTFAAYFEPADESFVLVSASPERFLRVDAGGVVETRPIKGTRPRGTFAEEDRFSRDALRESSKDRSENVMIVDLLRNDLSRVCAPGTVEVSDLFGVETYPSIHHLVSAVRGRLEPGRDALDLLAAAFPGGSVTGAPKIRAMEIIAELEPDARGAYCGCLGYLGFDGVLDTSILIRTATASRGWLHFPVGGGIVADSTPEHEYRETIDKARGMVWAID